MSHKKKAYQKMIACGAVPKRTHHSADAAIPEGDAECHYYWDNGVLYFSERGSSTPVTKCDSPNKADRYVKSQNKKRK
ncbi:MAG: hypothetical protein J6Y71_03175 [Ruminococcus sp.]|nr:hypothetical protein [Ruminococcus sp.]